MEDEVFVYFVSEEEDRLDLLGTIQNGIAVYTHFYAGVFEDGIAITFDDPFKEEEEKRLGRLIVEYIERNKMRLLLL